MAVFSGIAFIQRMKCSGLVLNKEVERLIYQLLFNPLNQPKAGMVALSLTSRSVMIIYYSLLRSEEIDHETKRVTTQTVNRSSVKMQGHRVFRASPVSRLYMR